MDRMSENDLREKCLDSEYVYDGRLLKVYSDKVELPGGRISRRDYIRHPGAVCVAAVTDDGEILIERQFRYPAGRVLTELPAGKLDGKDEDPLEAAKRELKEETGVTADHWESLGGMIPTCAYSTEYIYLYLATGLHFGERKLDEGEFLNVEKTPLKKLLAEILDGRIDDAKTQVTVLKLCALKDHSIT